MKLVIFSSISFISGVVLASVCFFLWSTYTDAKSGNECERLIDLSLGKANIEDVPILQKALQLGSTNQFEQCQILIREDAWWELEEAWTINKKYDGALESYLTPVLLHAYPQLKQKVNFNKFSRWPKSTLIEMTNFMMEADALVQSQK